MSFSREINTWYQHQKRDLPWRNTKNPYFIWLSEIILQQTRVDQGLHYYLNFTQAYPSVFDLAQADEEEVLKLWQGLGYYSRARNLHASAKQIVALHKGVFPSNYLSILALKGVGTYTAAAISSICFKLPYAVVDGNVYRLLSRYFGIATPIDVRKGVQQFEELAQELLDKKAPGDHNQAMMEFGAMQCKPKNPVCNDCPLRARCVAFNTSKVDSLPVKSKKLKQKDRFFNYLIIKSEYEVIIKKRTGKDIWKNLYDFPLIENDKKLRKEEIIASAHWTEIMQKNDYIIQSISNCIVHQLSHQRIHTTFWELKTSDLKNLDLEGFIRIKQTDMGNYPVPKLIENYYHQ
jgi:A/G-specific adenine glycosylase